MSSALFWRPVPKNKRPLSDALKNILINRHGDEFPVTMDSDDLPYLRGLADAGIKGAADLIEAIDKLEAVTGLYRILEIPPFVVPEKRIGGIRRRPGSHEAAENTTLKWEEMNGSENK